MKIDITERAKSMLGQSGIGKEKFLRICVKPGGCAGMTYDAMVEEAMKGGDVVIFEEGSIRIVADPMSLGFLDGLTIDYTDDLVQSGFKFSNPSCGSSCGCGASFEK